MADWIGISGGPISQGPISGSIPDQNAATLALTATEAKDVASASVTARNNAALAASETADTASASVSAVTNTALAATESADTASASVNASTRLTLAANENADTASASVSSVTSASLTATETADTAAASVSAQTRATLTATEAPDTASGLVELSNTVSLAATEAPDVASATLALSDTVSLAATESPDVVALVADAAQSFIDLAIAATEAPDRLAASVTAVAPVTVDLAATEAPDRATFEVRYGNERPDTHDGVGGPIHRVKDRWKWRSRQDEVREALARVTDDEEAVETAYEAIEAVVRNEPQAMDLLADFARRDQELYDQTLAIMAGVLSIKVAEQRQIAIQLAEAARQAAEEDDLEVLLLAA